MYYIKVQFFLFKKIQIYKTMMFKLFINFLKNAIFIYNKFTTVLGQFTMKLQLNIYFKLSHQTNIKMKLINNLLLKNNSNLPSV